MQPTNSPNGPYQGQIQSPSPLSPGSSNGSFQCHPQPNTPLPNNDDITNILTSNNLDNEAILNFLNNYSNPPTPLSTNDQTPMDETEFPSLPRRKRTIDSDGFITITGKNSKTHKPNPPSPPPPITVTNSFEPLSKIKPPPLILPRADYEPSKVSQFIIQKCPEHDFKIITTKSEIKILPASPESHSAISSLLQKSPEKVPFYTYAPKGTPQNKKYLIHGLDLQHPIASIKQALSHSDLLDVRRLTRTDPSGNKTEIEPILATFKPHYNPATHINTLRHIDRIIIRIKPYNPSKTIPQCHRCQRFGHTKNHCYLPPRCVRCSGEHTVSSCTRNNNPLSCANCKDAHPASYSKCPARLNLINQLANRKTAAKATTTPSFIPAPPPITNAWNAHPTTTHHNNFSQLPLSTPQTAPAPPLIPQPPPNYLTTPPPWFTNFEKMLNRMDSMMSTLQKLLDLIVLQMSK